MTLEEEKFCTLDSEMLEYFKPHCPEIGQTAAPILW